MIAPKLYLPDEYFPEQFKYGDPDWPVAEHPEHLWARHSLEFLDDLWPHRADLAEIEMMCEAIREELEKTVVGRSRLGALGHCAKYVRQAATGERGFEWWKQVLLAELTLAALSNDPHAEWNWPDGLVFPQCAADFLPLFVGLETLKEMDDIYALMIRHIKWGPHADWAFGWLEVCHRVTRMCAVWERDAVLLPARNTLSSTVMSPTRHRGTSKEEVPDAT